MTVAASSTLAVNSGVAIRGWTINSLSYLNIYGNLVVSGTNFSDIIFGSMFSSPAKDDWGGLRFYSGSRSAISGATFEYARAAIAYTDSPINLSNVKFNENNLGCRPIPLLWLINQRFRRNFYQQHRHHQSGRIVVKLTIHPGLSLEIGVLACYAFMACLWYLSKL